MARKEIKETAEKATEQPIVDDKVEKLKVKKKPKSFKKQEFDDVVKIDLSKKEEETTKDEEIKEEVKEEVVETTEKNSEDIKTEEKESPIIEEITDEPKELQTKEKIEEKNILEEALVENIKQNTELPEGIKKLMAFMDETGGDINDYVLLNRSYDDLNDQDLLYEYYKATKPHLTTDEVQFMLEDQFLIDEDVDEDKDIKRKKLALKEQVASARQHLDGLKSKYYEDIKMGSKLTKEQKGAIDFFNRYKKEKSKNEKLAKQQTELFLNKTNQVFNDEFKGFEYNVGDKRFRFNVKDVNDVKESQSDISNFVKKFLNEKQEMEDANGYHKSLFTAMNPDVIASHFYEQGKADALKDSVAKSKNIDMNPRSTHSDPINTSGLKFRVINDDPSPVFKFRGKNK